MFDNKEYFFKGRFADYVLKLVNTHNDQIIGSNGDFLPIQLIGRNVDIYFLAPLIGLAYGKRIDKSNDSDTSKSSTRVNIQQLNEYSEQILNSFRLVMLLDKDYEQDIQKRLHKAFDGTNTQEDYDRYESYLKGGLEFLYGHLMKESECKVPEVVFARNICRFVEDFYNTINSDLQYDNVLNKLN